MQDFMAGTTVSETITKLSDVSMMSPRDTQRANEYSYSRKYIDGYIRAEMEANEDYTRGDKCLCCRCFSVA